MITGAAGDDTITGTNVADVVDADAGNDVVSGLDESDFVCLDPDNEVSTCQPTCGVHSDRADGVVNQQLWERHE